MPLKRAEDSDCYKVIVVCVCVRCRCTTIKPWLVNCFTWWN